MVEKFSYERNVLPSAKYRPQETEGLPVPREKSLFAADLFPEYEVLRCPAAIRQIDELFGILSTI